jgi:hypothetical protein
MTPQTAVILAEGSDIGAEVDGPNPVLVDAFSDLCREIRADPELALGSGLAMDATRKLKVLGTGGRPSRLMGALADVIITLAEAALEDAQANE